MESGFQPRIIICADCHEEFVFTASAQQYFAERGYIEDPKRCKACHTTYKRTHKSEASHGKEAVYTEAVIDSLTRVRELEAGSSGWGMARYDGLTTGNDRSDGPIDTGQGQPAGRRQFRMEHYRGQKTVTRTIKLQFDADSDPAEVAQLISEFNCLYRALCGDELSLDKV